MAGAVDPVLLSSVNVLTSCALTSLMNVEYAEVDRGHATEPGQEQEQHQAASSPIGHSQCRHAGGGGGAVGVGLSPRGGDCDCLLISHFYALRARYA